MNPLEQELIQIREQGLFRSLRKIPSSAINFCSNDYLGLAQDPRLVEAAIEAVQRYGAGSGSARLIGGNFDLQERLETELAQFKRVEGVLLFNSGYHANIGLIPALAGEGDLIFSDELNHASLIDGCRLSKAEKVIYRHNDLNQLEDLLKNPPQSPFYKGGSKHGSPLEKGGKGGFLIITEAVFSMEGDICPLKDLLQLAEKYGATVYLDEAHAVGVFGENGEGLAPVPLPPHLITMGTLGKAFGSYGAFIAGSQFLKDYLINRARSFIFTTALPPAAVGASLAALKVIREEPERRQKLWQNIEYLKCRGGFQTRPNGTSPILSIQIGPADKTMEISQHLFERGIFLQGIRPPTVPEGTSRLRLTLSATHTKEELERLIECLKTI